LESVEREGRGRGYINVPCQSLREGGAENWERFGNL